MPRLKTLWVLLPALLSLGPGAAPLAGAGGPTAWAGGMVVDETGRPVAGARVELLRLISSEDGRSGVASQADGSSAGDETKPDRGYRALSGADGRFRIPDLPADAWFLLRVLQRGFTVLIQRGIDSPAAGGQIALGTLRLPKVPTVTGRVVDSKGRPLAGAQIWASSKGDLELRSSSIDLSAYVVDQSTLDASEAPAARTGPDGRFAIPCFEPGILEVCVKGLAPARVSSLAPGRNRIVLTPPSRRLAGRVVDGEGLPVAKAKVYLRIHYSDPDPWKMFQSMQERPWHPCSPRPTGGEAVPIYDPESFPVGFVALCDQEGRFAFDLVGPESTMEIRAEAAGYLQQNSTQVPTPQRSSGKIELVLERGATVSGRVLTARGLPAAGAALGISDGRSRETTPVRTDAAGRYRVTVIAPGIRDVTVQHPSGELRRQIEVAPGENRQPDLILDGDGSREIRGRVTGPDGVGIAGARVATTYLPFFHTSSGPDGAFRLELRESTVAGKILGLDVEKAGFAPRHLRLDPAATAAAMTTPLAIRLDPGMRITGHIFGVDPESLPGVNVYYSAADEAVDSHRSQVSRDGEFRIAGLAPGEVDVLADFGNRCDSARVTLEPGTEETVLNLEIPAITEARGTVLAPDGRPLAGAHVVFVRSAHEALSCQLAQDVTKEDGSFSTAIQEGRYNVLGEAPGYAPTTQEAPLTVGRSPVEGLEVRLGPGIALGGRLLGLKPEEIANASVGASSELFHRTGRIAADGSYRFDDLGPGDWSVEARVDTGELGRQRSGQVNLKPGEAAPTLDLDLMGTSSLTLRFAGVEGHLDYQAVLFQQEAGKKVVESPGEKSAPILRFTRLPAGKYRLLIRDYQHDRTVELPVALTADQEMVIDLSTPDAAGSS